MYSPENEHVPWKSMVGRCTSYWNSPFLGDMFVFGGVYIYLFTIDMYVINLGKRPLWYVPLFGQV